MPEPAAMPTGRPATGSRRVPRGSGRAGVSRATPRSRTARRTGAGHRTASPRRASRPPATAAHGQAVHGQAQFQEALPVPTALRVLAAAGCRRPAASTCRTAAGSRREPTGRTAHLGSSHRTHISHRTRGLPRRLDQALSPGGPRLTARPRPRRARRPRRVTASPAAARRDTTVLVVRGPRQGLRAGPSRARRAGASRGGTRPGPPSGSGTAPSPNAARSAPPSPSRPSRRTGSTRLPAICGHCAPRRNSITPRWPSARTTR
jgi:hypothetical protein